VKDVIVKCEVKEEVKDVIVKYELKKAVKEEIKNKIVICEELKNEVVKCDEIKQRDEDKETAILRNEEKKDIFTFEDASESWMANKKKKTNRHYVYLCGKKLSKGKVCKRYCCDTLGLYGGCAQHFNYLSEVF
jgi:hypothetical protein